MQTIADAAVDWSKNNNMQLNGDKTKEMIITFRRTCKNSATPPVLIGDKEVERVTTFKLLGCIISSQLTWSAHVDYLISKGSQRLYFLCLLRRASVGPDEILCVYVSTIRSLLEYACCVGTPVSQQHSQTGWKGFSVGLCASLLQTYPTALRVNS